jgi:hypothetical protein
MWLRIRILILLPIRLTHVVAEHFRPIETSPVLQTKILLDEHNFDHDLEENSILAPDCIPFSAPPVSIVVNHNSLEVEVLPKFSSASAEKLPSVISAITITPLLHQMFSPLLNPVSVNRNGRTICRLTPQDYWAYYVRFQHGMA